MAGKIIKSGSVPDDAVPVTTAQPVVGKVIDRQVHGAQQEAREILERAECEAERIVAAARAASEERVAAAEREAAEIREAAKDSANKMQAAARDRGLAEGLAAWEARVLEATRAVDERVAEARDQVVHLAMQTARKLLRRELEARPESIVPTIESALRTLGRSGRDVRVHVHPEDAAALAAARADLVVADPRWEHLRVVAEESMERGGCRIESEIGTVDASVESQLRAIEEHLLAPPSPRDPYEGTES